MTLEALIFDVDGTLADTEESHRQAFNAAFIQYELWWEWDHDLYAELLSISGGRERIAAFVESRDVPDAEKERLRNLVPAIHRTKTELFTQLIADGRARFRRGVARLLREAHDRGMRVAIASTTTAVNVEALLATNLGPNAYRDFACIACGDQVEHKKPAPDIYQLAIHTLGVAPETCVAFEDSANGVTAAKAAGLFTVATPTRWTARQDFAAADLVLPDLGDAEHPFDAATAARVGGKWLGLAELAALHSAARQRAA
jgi:HAD superfamily hydrolase (TIGR01509 family)